MKKQPKRWFALSTIRQKISAVIVISIVGAVLLCMVSTLIIMRRQMLTRTEAGAYKDLQMVCEKLDLLVEQVERDAILILASDSCQNLLRQADKRGGQDILERNKLYRTINENMLSMVNGQNTYRSVAFYDTTANAYMVGSLTADPAIMPQKQQENLQFIAHDAHRRWQTLHTSPWVSGIKQKSAQDCISYQRKVYAKDSGNLIGIMELELNSDVIWRLYHSVTSNSNQLYLLDEDNMIISSSAPQMLYATFPDRVDSTPIRLIGQNTSASKDFFYNARDYEPLGWRVVLATSQAPYRDEMLDFGIVYSVMMLLLLAIILLLSNQMTLSIIHPIEEITGTIQKIGNGDYRCRVEVNARGELKTMADEFNRMVDEINHLMVQIRSTEQQKRQSELSLIQMQITPHFFYNILESICGLIVMGEKNTAIKTIQYLSDFYRGVLGKGQEIISLQEELDISRNYLQIMQVCYPATFSYAIHMDSALGICPICKLTLQPLLENAIHHGIVAGGCEGYIDISVSQREDKLVICIQDDGVGMSEQTLAAFYSNNERVQAMDSFGMRNTHDRIKLYFGSEYGVSIESQEQVGTQVTILLPIRPTRED